MPIVPAAELGEPENPDDPTALARLPAVIAAHHGRPENEAAPALGTSHALWLAYAASLAPGDEVLVETPVYEPLVRAVPGFGATVRLFERRREDGFAVDVDRVVALLGPKTTLVSLSNLHNPSGVRTPDETIADLAGKLAARNVHLHVDEVYAPFDATVPGGVALDASGHFARTARRLGDNVIATGSLTKVYGLAPHRIGWLLARPAIAARARAAVEISMGHPPARWANMAIHGFAAIPKLAARSTRILGQKRETVALWMDAHPELEWSNPAEGLFGMAICRNDHFDMDAAIERGIADLDLCVAPSRFFGQKNGFRLAWSLDEARLPEALNRLDRLISSAR